MISGCYYYPFQLQGSVMSCEYLLLNGARINCQDADGKTPLYLATELGTFAIAFVYAAF